MFEIRGYNTVDGITSVQKEEKWGKALESYEKAVASREFDEAELVTVHKRFDIYESQTAAEEEEEEENA